ncbi:MAG: hypothetical protein INH41_22290 [Myxococcaceae bacterium]|jgi:hypothetical protein|nr:hypothetical protein [Myxococcaceae bacterium]MCA3015126.1 hypothetical protein [Myxococcaceae bacterium]
MNRLPREVSSLLEAPPDDAAVQRVWVRLSRSRTRPPRGRVAVLGAALAASVVGFVLSQFEPSRERLWGAPSEGALPGAPVAGRGATLPAAGLAVPGRQGRPLEPARAENGGLAGMSPGRERGVGAPTGAGDVTHGPPAPAPVPLASAMVQGRARRLAQRVTGQGEPADVVGHLLESAVEAFTEDDARRAAALLARAIAAHPDDPRVPEALVTLGWLQLEYLDAPEDARASLERAMEVSLPQELFDRAWPLLQRAQRCAGRAE